MAKYAKALSVLLLACSLSLTAMVYAQAQEEEASPARAAPAAAPEAASAPSPEAEATVGKEAAPVPITLTPEELHANFGGSLFLTPSEITAIRLAKLGRPASNVEVGGVVIPQHREISVSGVLYRSAKDWIVWMNGKKVTPKELLPEIVDIKVESSSRVRLKWYDAGLDSVIAITLRPHQTYDITSGILLPGSDR
jgi:hypothetical protein